MYASSGADGETEAREKGFPKQATDECHLVSRGFSSSCSKLPSQSGESQGANPHGRMFGKLWEGPTRVSR